MSIFFSFKNFYLKISSFYSNMRFQKGSKSPQKAIFVAAFVSQDKFDEYKFLIID